MMPLHFGRRDRRLFGVYAPALGRRTGRGVVICNPWGIECLRAHRSLKHLADAASKAGFDVLRFDYYGTGDSYGDGRSPRLAQWVEDTQLAVEELVGTSAAKSVALVGLRLGANVAAAAAPTRPEVDRVVLWEPLTSGSDYVRELVERLDQSPGWDPEVAGFPFPDQFQDEVLRMSLRGLPGSKCRVLVARGTEPQPNELDGIEGAEVAVSVVPSPGCWVEENDFGAGAVPVEMLRSVIKWLE